ncbi:MAG: hypothetical protein AB7U98_15785 [Candidatus Nitrosocosmicus sp.]|jgi:hypothetical protein|nr:hypothetical protein [Candidatus Nitrosocosmicus sp.]
MNKLFTGILSVFLVAGIMGVYVPDALASIFSERPLETCGNIAVGQQPSSSAEQETEQDQASETDGQAVAPEFNALNANNINLGLQQNGECIPTFEQPPTDSTIPE